MLGGARSNIVTDITISASIPPGRWPGTPRTAIQRGYDCLKVEVGIDPELDVARLAAVREAAFSGGPVIFPRQYTRFKC